jgi:WD40 repeat protein
MFYYYSVLKNDLYNLFDHQYQFHIICSYGCILQVLCGHTNYVNYVTYEPAGQFLASVSDDHTCKIWNIKEDNSCTATFFLTSPGSWEYSKAKAKLSLCVP